MTIRQMNIDGNAFLGVYCRATEETLLHPTGMDKKLVKGMTQTLEVEPVQLTVGGSTLLGSLICANSTGMIISSIAYRDNYRHLEKDLNIIRSPDKLNACGNNILCNDRAALVHPGYTKKLVKRISETLGVEVEKGTLAGIRTVGSAAVAVNKGVLCHPKTSEDEMAHLRDLFKVNVQIGTANYGSAMVGASMVANTKGAVVGTLSTGIELGRIEDALGFLD